MAPARIIIAAAIALASACGNQPAKIEPVAASAAGNSDAALAMPRPSSALTDPLPELSAMALPAALATERLPLHAVVRAPDALHLHDLGGEVWASHGVELVRLVADGPAIADPTWRNGIELPYPVDQPIDEIEPRVVTLGGRFPDPFYLVLAAVAGGPLEVYQWDERAWVPRATRDHPAYDWVYAAIRPWTSGSFLAQREFLAKEPGIAAKPGDTAAFASAVADAAKFEVLGGTLDGPVPDFGNARLLAFDATPTGDALGIFASEDGRRLLHIGPTHTPSTYRVPQSPLRDRLSVVAGPEPGDAWLFGGSANLPYLARLHDKALRRVAVPHCDRPISALAIAAAGDVILACEPDRLLRLTATESWTALVAAADRSIGRIVALASSPDGSLWIHASARGSDAVFDIRDHGTTLELRSVSEAVHAIDAAAPLPNYSSGCRAAFVPLQTDLDQAALASTLANLGVPAPSPTPALVAAMVEGEATLGLALYPVEDPNAPYKLAVALRKLLARGVGAVKCRRFDPREVVAELRPVAAVGDPRPAPEASSAGVKSGGEDPSRTLPGPQGTDGR